MRRWPSSAARPAGPGSPRRGRCWPGARRVDVGGPGPPDLDLGLRTGVNISMRVFVTGSIAFDYIMVFPGRFRDHILPEKMHVLSVSFLVDSLQRLRGGTAANIAYNLALLGERPTVVGTVGDDFGEYRSWLGTRGVDTTAIQV